MRSLKNGAITDRDPWEGATLEWAADSPPANYNFEHLPVVKSRYPLWSEKGDRAIVVGLRNNRREVVITSLMDAEPQHRSVLPNSTIWPFLTAVGFTIGLVGSIMAFSWYFVASALGTIGLIGWFWPREPLDIKP